MEKGTIKFLIDKYGLPLDIRKDWWFGDYYFHAERTVNNRVFGSAYRNGSLYEAKDFSIYEEMELCYTCVPVSNKQNEIDDNIPNPNNLDINKDNYIKGKTKLFVNKGGKLTVAYFDRFEQKNGEDVIYVIREGEVSPGFYLFPQSEYLFPNKDDAGRALDESKRRYVGATTSLATNDAFEDLPKANIPSNSVETETQYEKKYHNKVDEELVDKIRIPQTKYNDGQDELACEKRLFREELKTAREDGFRLDDHAYISHSINVEHTNQKINDARTEIYRLEKIREKPYFARIDCGKNMKKLGTAYIGDHDIPGFVVDWRHSEIGNAYYHSDLFMNREDVVLALKRIISINIGQFLGYDDQINLYYSDLCLDNETSSNGGYTENADALLNKLLAESRLDKKTHDIIKTIQGEQYDIITSDFTQNAVINGCAGSGKTMIMYHRLSYMAYNYETVLGKKFNPEQVYIISPSPFFDSSNNELMMKLSIDKVQQAPFNEQVENLLWEYSKIYGAIPFYGIVGYVKPEGDTSALFFSDDSFNSFHSELKTINNNSKTKKNYKEWILNTVNKILISNEFEAISNRKIPNAEKDINTLFDDYFHNDCFIIKEDRTKEGIDKNRKWFSSYAVTSISYDNVVSALGTFDAESDTYVRRQRRVNRNAGMLKIALSLSTRKNDRGEIVSNIPEFWRLVDKETVFRKMLALIVAKKMLQCLFVKDGSNDDYILKCLYAYKNKFSEQHINDFSVYVLHAMNNRFGGLEKEGLVFVDEFQNYSSFELNCLKTAFKSSVFNLYGDYDQRIEDKGVDLREKISVLLSPNAYNINVNYRNARQITEYINNAVHKNMQSVGINGTVIETALVDCKFKIKDRTAVICKDVKLANLFLKRYLDLSVINDVSRSHKLVADKFALMTVSDCKGLEFDTVYVLDYGMNENEKYVAYTRALDNLIVISDDLEELRRIEKENKHKKAEEEKRKRQEERKKKGEAEKRQKIEKENQNIVSTEQQDVVNSFLTSVPKDETTKLELCESVELTERELQLEKKIAEIQEEAKRNNEVREKTENERKEKLYSLAKRKIQSDDVSQIKEAVFLLETILDYKDATDLIVCAKMKIESVSNENKARKMAFKTQKRCQYCGGKFKGIFTRVCKECGKTKDY